LLSDERDPMDFDEILGPEDVTTSVYTCKVKDR